MKNRENGNHRNSQNQQNSRDGWRHAFHRFACKTADAMGSPWAFLMAVTVIVVWAFLGPMFGYSDTWQLVINTGTTIVTFLMVFLIQNTQNRDAKAFHLKLDELIHAIKGARNQMIDLEDMTDEELEAMKKEFEKIAGRRQEQGRGSERPKETVAR
jgi:low affinity Fe/Cu permease